MSCPGRGGPPRLSTDGREASKAAFSALERWRARLACWSSSSFASSLSADRYISTELVVLVATCITFFALRHDALWSLALASDVPSATRVAFLRSPTSSSLTTTGALLLRASSKASSSFSASSSCPSSPCDASRSSLDDFLPACRPMLSRRSRARARCRLCTA